MTKAWSDPWQVGFAVAVSATLAANRLRIPIIIAIRMASTDALPKVRFALSDASGTKVLLITTLSLL